MKKKPDILVVLAAVLGLGIMVSSVGGSDEQKLNQSETETNEAQVALQHTSK
ncbi:MAG: hypothetical protein HWE27_02020 [Gammaproteobacteria bacterium]|nr:hypothetical protein [Gammaproteobacteria bacterium]